MVEENIQRLREIRGLTQEEIASKLNMSLSAYGKLERGETSLSFEKAKSIAKILNVSIADLDEFDDKSCVQINQPNSTLSNCQQGHFVNSGLSENERKLYEEIIKIKDEEILRLKKSNNLS